MSQGVGGCLLCLRLRGHIHKIKKHLHWRPSPLGGGGVSSHMCTCESTPPGSNLNNNNLQKFKMCHATNLQMADLRIPSQRSLVEKGGSSIQSPGSGNKTLIFLAPLTTRYWTSALVEVNHPCYRARDGSGERKRPTAEIGVSSKGVPSHCRQVKHSLFIPYINKCNPVTYRPDLLNFRHSSL